MIYKYNPVTLNQWTRGELNVELLQPQKLVPLGYCDGTQEDEDALRAMAESEGVEDLPIHKRLLKTGRQIWTVGAEPEGEEADEG